MKKNTLALPLSLTAALTSVVALSLSCDKKNSPHAEHWDTPQSGTNSPSVAANASSASSHAAAAASAPGEITNPPAAATTLPPSPATPEIAPTAPADNGSTSKKTTGQQKVVEMSTTPPAVPKHFYAGDFATNHCCLGTDYEFAIRAGYLHAGYGDNHDTAYGGVKFYAHPDQLRAMAGKNGWLIPDLTAELSHQYLPKPDNTANPGSGEGLQLRADLYWPWISWTMNTLASENAVCPFSGPLHFALGPVFVTGFDKTFDGSGFRFARYGGARLTLNRYAFVQYAYGQTDGLAHDRQEVLAELPFYVSHDGRVRYVLRGEWSRGELDLPDYYQAGAFLEMPLDLIAHPREWRDLIPFVN